MKRIAQCHCGQLTVETDDELEQIFMCHGEDCQRRMGTGYNSGALFPISSTVIKGGAQ